MKLFFNLLGMAGAGYLGYMAEPSLRYQLTGEKPGASELAGGGKAIIKSTDGSPDIEIPLSKLPKRIQIVTPLKVTDTASGMTMTLEAGTSVKLLKLDGTDAVVSPGESTLEVAVAIADTDLFQQLGIGDSKPVEPTPAPVAPEPTPEPAPVPVPEPATPPAGESAEPPVMAEPPPVPEPAPAPVPIPEPTPVQPIEPPTAAEGAEGQDSATVAVIRAMQESVKAGQIKEFTAEQVLEWQAGAVESVDGVSYQTGIASYKAETIFGMKAIQAKALIKDGKVSRWIWPKSGMEIK